MSGQKLFEVPRICCVVAIVAICSSFVYIAIPDLTSPLLVIALWGSAIVGVLVILLAIARMMLVKTSSRVLDLVNIALGAIPVGHGVWLFMMLNGAC